MTEEIKKEAIEEKKPEVKDTPEEFKIAEIWFKKGTIMLDAPPMFYYDKLRAYGVLEICRQIIQNTKYETEKPSIIQTGVGGLRNFLNRKKR